MLYTGRNHHSLSVVGLGSIKRFKPISTLTAPVFKYIVTSMLRLALLCAVVRHCM